MKLIGSFYKVEANIGSVVRVAILMELTVPAGLSPSVTLADFAPELVMSELTVNRSL